MFLSPYTRGVLLIAGAAVILSTFGLMIRFIESASPWELVFWRSLGVVLTASCLLGVRHRGRAVAVVRASILKSALAGIFLAGGLTFFILSITHTTVGNTLFTMSVFPFVGAVLGWALLGERVRFATWVAVVLAFAGVAVMFLDDLSGGELAGRAYAIAMAVSGACYFVVLRKGKDGDMAAAVGFGGLFSMLIALVPAWPLATPLHDIAIAIAIGVLQNGIGQSMIAAGSREVPVSQMSLLCLIEVVLGPIWVYLAVGEQMSTYTMIGGAVIVATIAADALGGIRRAARPLEDALSVPERQPVGGAD